MAAVTLERTAITVAIDGPSGSGKSSVSRAVAQELGLQYLDTGAMFRAVTWWCVHHEVDLSDQDVVSSATVQMSLEMVTDPGDPHVLVEGQRVEKAIRTPQISQQVSQVATNRAVREHLASEQRRIISQARGGGAGIVVEGRDITTVIAPEAEHRILLSASESARMSRRSAELVAGGAEQAADAVHDQVIRRDRDDATVSQFFAPADGVHGIDTSALTFQQSVAAVLEAIQAGAREPEGATPELVEHPSTFEPGEL